jgi:hypothetical protein
MMAEHRNNYPKIHNAMWPGVVGKGSGDGEPTIDLDTLLELTSKAEYDGQRFDGVDLWLADPHISIDSTADDIKRVIEKFQRYNFEVGSYVVPIWGGAGGGSAMGDAEERKRFLGAVRKGSAIGKQMRDAGIRPRTGTRTRSAAPSVLPRRSARRARSPSIMARSVLSRARSVGAACIPGGRT